MASRCTARAPKRALTTGVPIVDIAQIRALSSPLRQKIVDTLSAAGRLTVRELSERIGRPADRLYYHLKQLSRVGLVIPSESSSRTDRTETAYTVRQGPLYIRYDPGSPANRKAVCAVVQAQLKTAMRDFRRSFDATAVVEKGPMRNLWGGRVEGAVSRRHLKAINECLWTIAHLIQGDHAPIRDGDGVLQFSFAMSPVKKPDRRRTRR